MLTVKHVLNYVKLCLTVLHCFFNLSESCIATDFISEKVRVSPA